MRKEKKPKPNKERRLEKEILGIILFLALLVAVFFIASSYFKSKNIFEYRELTFAKQRLGNIPIYYHYYYFKAPDGKVIKYNMYLRNDPRSNNVTLIGDESRLLAGGEVAFISINADGLQECRYGPLAVGTLSSFLADNQMTVIGGNLDFWQAGIKRDEWVTCENKPGNRVVEILSGNETRVDISGKCYRVEVNNCEILDAVEKLMVESIVDARRVSL